jgi:hypothetical protein
MACTAKSTRAIAAALCLGVIALAGCQRHLPAESPEGVEPAQPAAKEAQSEGAGGEAEGITLTAAQAAKLGIATEDAKPIEYAAETSGFGIIMAQAAAHQSRAALERAHRLAGTPGAMSADATDSSTRQAQTDGAALALAEQRLTTIVGTGPRGGIAKNEVMMRALANGTEKLLRATFPLGALQGSAPATLRAAHIDSLSPGATHPAQGWSVKSVWAAPADATVPGRSFFGLVQSSDAAEGERLLVWAPGTGPSREGVRIPAASLVISDGKFWCYVETKPYVYVRRQINPDRPVSDGYFVAEGISAGEKIVTTAAGLLLAHETNPSTEAD